MSSELVSNEILVCEPIRDLKSILQWIPPENSWAKFVVEKTKRTSFSYLGPSTECITSGDRLPECPKTLVCHDMKGGYLEDRFVYGSDKHNGYRFIHWSSVDVFVYFSHNLLTIPPLGWINAGHKHGVPVLGTLISEWKDGEAIWNEVLEDPAKILELCQKLSEIAEYYGFDGYLINVENKIKPEHIFSLVDFVKILKSLLLSHNPDSLVYWYDSVIIPSGDIKYQNKLNGYNVGFFDVCDGIFLNYNWSAADLVLSAKNSRNRLHDVFVGVDVFGRGCYGGGGFNTRLAVELISQHGLSVALFAPGWVHETLKENDSFIHRDYLFWSSIKPLLYTKGPASLPFQTSFCQGYGEKLYQRGIVISDSPWYDLSKQEYQPSDIIGSNNEMHCISHYARNAFNGGSCILVNKCHEYNRQEQPKIHRLFLCEFKFLYETVVRLSVTSSSTEHSVRPDVSLVLSLENFDGTLTRKILCSNQEMERWPEISDFILPKRYTDYFENRNTAWEQRDFEFTLSNTAIVGIGCALGENSPPVLLGHMSIDTVQQGFQNEIVSS